MAPGKSKYSMSWGTLAFIAAASALIAVYCELFRESARAGDAGLGIALLARVVTPGAAAFMVAVFLVSCAALSLLVSRGKRLGSFCFKWRYAIALAVLVVLVAFEVSGSSIGYWNSVLAQSDIRQADGLLFGVPRGIRSDEWRVLTPMALSQQHDGYSAVSNILRAAETDVTMTYALPCWSIATLFRPFLWGYLALGGARGLSFFWCARLIALFMVSFEFGRLLSKDRRLIALAYALAGTFAPMVQWWYAVNGTVELFVFGQGMVLAFAAFLRAKGTAGRAGFSALFAWCAGGFILILYPAWQVTVGYVVAALLIGSAIDFRLSGRARAKAGIAGTIGRWLPFACAIAVLAVLMLAVLFNSLDTIRTTMNTAYPGARMETGGGRADMLLSYVTSLLGPIIPGPFKGNVCESAQTFFSLFPLGIILAAAALARKRDPYLICLLVAEAFLIVYSCVGLPEWLAKLSLLSVSRPDRAIAAISFSESLLALRSICILAAAQDGKERTRRAATSWAPVAAAAVFAAALTLAALFLSSQITSGRLLYILCFFMVLLCAYAVLRAAQGAAENWRLPVAACVIALAGAFVNPVQIGIAPLADSDYAHSVEAVAAQDESATWIADSSGLGQANVAVGAPTINSVATYPDLDRWHALDKDGAYEEVYNRYAHIDMQPTSGETTFELVHADAFIVHINPDDAREIGARYWVTGHDLAKYDTERTKFTKVADAGPYAVYRIEAAT